MTQRSGAAPAAVIVAGVVVGALGVLPVFALLAALVGATPGFGPAVREAIRGVAAGDPAFVALVVGGGLIGGLAAGAGLGVPAVRRISGVVTGAVLGAVAGLAIYAVGFAASQDPRTASSFTFFVGQALFGLAVVEFVFLAFGAVVGAVIGRYPWRFYGVLTLVALLAVVTGFLTYAAFVTMPRVDPGWRWLAAALFLAEAGVLGMVVLYNFYTVDVATRKRWTKRPEDVDYSSFFVPKVAFQVPAFNEPPEMVIQTLQKLLEVDYPRDRYVVMMLDDSTDEEKRRPVEEFCEEHDIIYLHREDRGGYKAGALNNALDHTPEDVELLAIIDADYQVDPTYLRENVGYFVNPELAWVQTPQDFRNRHESFLTEQYFVADAFFYKTVMPSRNEENAIIFAGTMGIVRKPALETVGGWGEEYISEDAELSVRLLDEGYDSLYINKSYGKGLIPPTYDGYKKQQYRWAFGGAKILKGHFDKLFRSRLRPRQRFDFFVGSAHWFEGIPLAVISWVVLLLALGEAFEFRVASHHSDEIVLVGLVPLLLLGDGLTRLHMVMRKSMRLSFAQTLGVMGMWFAVKFSNAWGALKSGLGASMPFVRTPKAPERRIGRAAALARAVRAAPFESTMAALSVAVATVLAVDVAAPWLAGGSGSWLSLLLLFWVVYYVFVYGAAPLYGYLSYATFRPEAASGQASGL